MNKKTKLTLSGIAAIIAIFIFATGFRSIPELFHRIFPGRSANAHVYEPGDTIHFGKWDWQVLDVDAAENRALLITKNVIEQRAYNDDFTDISWAECTLHDYLNGEEFKKNFSDEEWARILDTENINADNQWYGTSGGRNTTDKIFLLSLEEVVKYFGDSGDLGARKGWYWENDKDELKDGKGYYINDRYNIDRVAKFNGDGSWWWLRSPGYNQNSAAFVGNDGSVILYGISVDIKPGGVRPALWLELT